MTTDKLKTLILHLAIGAALVAADAIVLAISGDIKDGTIAIPATAGTLVLTVLALLHTEIQSAEGQPPAPNPPAAGSHLVLK